jgi:hypothetical protein
MKGCISVLLWPVLLPFRFAAALVMFPFQMLAALLAAMSLRCGVCGTLIKKQSYMWEIEGRMTKVCPGCNKRLQNELSKNGVRHLMAKLK